MIVNRFDKEEAITMDWHVDGAIPLGTYSVQVGREDRDTMRHLLSQRHHPSD